MVDPPVVYLGRGCHGDAREFQILLRNVSPKTIRIVGGTSACSCVATNDLPVVIEGGQSAQIAVRVVFKGYAGDFQKAFLLYTDDDAHTVAVARFGGEIVESPE